MSEVVFEVVSKLSKKIALTTKGYEHISERHPEVSGEFEKMKETLVNPRIIRKSMYDDKVWLFYRLFSKTPVSRKYLMVSVRLFNNKGIVITSYFTDKIKMGDEIWREE
ncbi:MAG: hypothetical protein ABSC20_10710 [Candidatus Bathyarchaeia archaeon]|jgi:hypothetical protein